MINRTLFAGATMALLIGALGACGRTPDQTGHAAPPAIQARQLKEPLFDHFVPEFPYHLRSISEKKSKQGTDHVVMLEARGVNHDTLLKDIDHSMKLIGYGMEFRKGKETVISGYRSVNGEQVAVRIGPIDPNYTYQVSDATAIVRITWRDGVSAGRASP